MNFNKTMMFVSALVATLCVAAVPGDTAAFLNNGSVVVLASAAVQVASTNSARNAIAIFNNGPNTIWCGGTSAVTTATGFPILTQTFLAVDVRIANNGTGKIFCIASTADQVSPADTRWIEVR